MTPDQLNGLFELTGGLLVANNARRVSLDRGYAGMTWPATTFFLSWGLWNLFYYPHLGQWCSFIGGTALCAANICWVAQMLRWGKKT